MMQHITENEEIYFSEKNRPCVGRDLCLKHIFKVRWLASTVWDKPPFKEFPKVSSIMVLAELFETVTVEMH